MARIDGTNGNNTLRGGNSRDVIQRVDRKEMLYSNGGKDVMYGGNGVDVLSLRMDRSIFEGGLADTGSSSPR